MLDRGGCEEVVRGGGRTGGSDAVGDEVGRGAFGLLGEVGEGEGEGGEGKGTGDGGRWSEFGRELE